MAGINSSEGLERRIGTQNASLEPRTICSVIELPIIELVQYQTLGTPCITPRLRRGVRSEVERIATLIMTPPHILVRDQGLFFRRQCADQIAGGEEEVANSENEAASGDGSDYSGGRLYGGV